MKTDKSQLEKERLEALQHRAAKEHQWQLIRVTLGKPDPGHGYQLHHVSGSGRTHIFGDEDTTLDDIEKHLDEHPVRGGSP